ncbi:MAG: hypothetical protein IPO21_18965 [Bacteroidales bacterium]|nr:hypothetical protein [Bacteroidales bacterium]
MTGIRISNIKIKVATKEMYTAMQFLVDEYLGNAYFDINIAEKRSEKFIVFVALFADDIVGLAINEVFTNTDEAMISLSKNVQFEKFLGQAQSVGRQSVLIVKSQFENNGIGAALFSESLLWLKTHAEFVYTVRWLKSATDKGSTLLSRNGFEPIARIENFWKIDSLTRKYHCPICGEPPCLCSALIYRAI